MIKRKYLYFFFRMSKLISGLKNNIAFNPFKKKDLVVGSDSTAQVRIGTIQQFKNYVILVLTDYQTVAKETLVQMKKQPIKTSIYAVLAGSIVVCYKKNPHYQNYIEARRSYANDMLMCVTGYNKKSEFYLNSLNKLEYCNRLEYRSFLIFSLIMDQSFCASESTYEKQCTQLNNPSKWNVFNYTNKFVKFLSRIVDVGFFDNWYFLNKNLVDYDVDDSEWSNLNK